MQFIESSDRHRVKRMLQHGHSACAGNLGRVMRMALGVRILGCFQIVLYWNIHFNLGSYWNIH